MIRTLILGLLLALCACGSGNEEEQGPDEATLLYRKTLALTRLYTDSLRLAPDTMSVQEVFKRFNAAYDSLNLSVAANTDLELGEDRNDTIVIALDRLLETRRQRLQSLYRHPIDTLPQPASTTE